MASVNKAILIGYVGKDPTTRTTQAGTKIVSFSMATSEAWKDKATGDRKEDTSWHPIVIFDQAAADFAEKHIRKGVMVWVEGAIKPRKWVDQNTHQDKYITEIVVQAYRGSVKLLTDPPGGQAAREPERAQPQRQADRTSARGDPQWDDTDSEIPF